MSRPLSHYHQQPMNDGDVARRLGFGRVGGGGGCGIHSEGSQRSVRQKQAMAIKNQHIAKYAVVGANVVVELHGDCTRNSNQSGSKFRTQARMKKLVNGVIKFVGQYHYTPHYFDFS